MKHIIKLKIYNEARRKKAEALHQYIKRLKGVKSEFLYFDNCLLINFYDTNKMLKNEQIIDQFITGKQFKNIGLDCEENEFNKNTCHIEIEICNRSRAEINYIGCWRKLAQYINSLHGAKTNSCLVNKSNYFTIHFSTKKREETYLPLIVSFLSGKRIKKTLCASGIVDFKFVIYNSFGVYQII